MSQALASMASQLAELIERDDTEEREAFNRPFRERARAVIVQRDGRSVAMLSLPLPCKTCPNRQTEADIIPPPPDVKPPQKH